MSFSRSSSLWSPYRLCYENFGKRILEAVLRFYEESKAARILNVSNLRCKSSKSENAILELPGALW